MTPDERAARLQELEEPQADRIPRLGKKNFHCPCCGTFAYQKWEELGYALTTGSFRSLESNAYGGGRWRSSTCVLCSEPAVWRDDQMVYPLTRLGGQAHMDMPDEVRELYEEAATVAAVSRRAGAALARATVERLIKVLDPTAPKGSNLAARIERIKQLGVTKPLGQMLDVVRETGNKALHVEDQPSELVVLALDDVDGPQILELLLETANDLVAELITRPKTTSALWDKLPAAVKAKLAQGASDGNATAP